MQMDSMFSLSFCLHMSGRSKNSSTSFLASCSPELIPTSLMFSAVLSSRIFWSFLRRKATTHVFGFRRRLFVISQHSTMIKFVNNYLISDQVHVPDSDLFLIQTTHTGEMRFF